MDAAPITQLSPKQPGNTRLPPWPFGDDITTKICRFARRETSAALSIALYKSKPGELGASAALQSVYYEPFTYWDWHGTHPDDISAFKNKKQLLWERERGFTIRDRREGYPTPREAWQQFQSLVNDHTGRRGWVKRIAVAHWMTIGDIKWIFKTLTSLEALDLSDVSTSQTSKGDGIANGALPSANDTWPMFFRARSSKRVALPLLVGLKWLGLPDFCGSRLATLLFLLQSVLPLCTKLQTLSIRGEYKVKMVVVEKDVHAYICDFIHGLIGNTPSSVSSLELRLPVLFLDRILIALLGKPELNVKQVGIDLGAWVQMYPLRDTSLGLSDREIASTSRIAAKQSFFKVFEKEHKKKLPQTSKWHLSQLQVQLLETRSLVATSHSAAESNNPRSGEAHGKPAFEHEFFRARHGSDPLDDDDDDDDDGEPQRDSGCGEDHQQLHLWYSKVNSLPSMLERLYDAEAVAAPDGVNKQRNFRFYPLQPEWQVKSTMPLHPMALLKSSYGKPVATTDDSQISPPVYKWLRETFDWQPIFDWDPLITPDLERLKYILDAVQPETKEQDPNTTAKDRLDAITVEIAKQFQHLRSMGIPIHVLIGRRNSDQSSLYWGWAHAERAWEEFLAKPFDAGLKQAAAHIDTLSVFYDLRNPLDEERLEEIDELQPYHRPDACCPRPTCPWRDNNNCPFKTQWADRSLWKPKPSTQKTTNRKGIGKISRLKLASNLESCPPTSEYVDKDMSDDTTLDEAAPGTLHQLARRAAFGREALGWQRFWAEYASQLTHLKELRVRMPDCFDRVRSWDLSKLLGSKDEDRWKMFSYADERGHVQTHEDLVRHAGGDASLHTHMSQDKAWPGDSFVRRTWIKHNWNIHPTTKALYRGEEVADGPGEWDDSANPRTKSKREQEEFDKAVKNAREAGIREQELEQRLRSERHLGQSSSPAPESDPIESQLTGAYGPHVRNIARSAWRREMRALIEQLEDQPAHDTIAPTADSEGSEDALAREVLHNTRVRLQQRLQNSRPADVFTLEDSPNQSDVRRISLVSHGREWFMEEQQQRKGNDAEEDGISDIHPTIETTPMTEPDKPTETPPATTGTIRKPSPPETQVAVEVSINVTETKQTRSSGRKKRTAKKTIPEYDPNNEDDEPLPKKTKTELKRTPERPPKNPKKNTPKKNAPVEPTASPPRKPSRSPGPDCEVVMQTSSGRRSYRLRATTQTPPPDRHMPSDYDSSGSNDDNSNNENKKKKNKRGKAKEPVSAGAYEAPNSSTDKKKANPMKSAGTKRKEKTVTREKGKGKGGSKGKKRAAEEDTQEQSDEEGHVSKKPAKRPRKGRKADDIDGDYV